MLRALAAPLDLALRARVTATPKLSERLRSDATTTCTLPITAESGESMAELAAEPQQGEPPELSPALRQRGWSINQGEGDWYYVHTAPNGCATSQFESPGHGWPAAQLLGREQADQLFGEAVAEAVEECAEDTAGKTCYICYGEGDEEGLVRGCACRGENGSAHVSCLARGAQAAVERDADTGWTRWHTCGLCEQYYHGVVRCALGWACWKTYVGRPEEDQVRALAMSILGNGLFIAHHHEDALLVREALLSLERRVGAPEDQILVAQSNLANSYAELGRDEEALLMKRGVHSARLKLDGEEHEQTLIAAINYACSLLDLERFEAAKALLRRRIPVARRVLGESDETTLKMRLNYAMALYRDTGATLDDISEAVTVLEETERIARRVLGGAHPDIALIEDALQCARAALRETLDDLREAVNTLEETIRTVRRRLGDSHPVEFVIEDRLQELRGMLRAREASDDETVDVLPQEDDADDTE